jgi:hypothetical protein
LGFDSTPLAISQYSAPGTVFISPGPAIALHRRPDVATIMARGTPHQLPSDDASSFTQLIR